LTFDISINRAVFVIFMMSTPKKGFSHVRSIGQISVQAYKTRENPITPEHINTSTYKQNSHNVIKHQLIISNRSRLDLYHFYKLGGVYVVVL